MAFACGLPPAEISLHLACGAAMLLLTFGMFTRGWIGGGDAKLAAATAIWLGFDHVGDYALPPAFLAVCSLSSSSVFESGRCQAFYMAHRWAARLHEPGNGIPYGVALASAGLILYPETAIWLAAAAALR